MANGAKTTTLGTISNVAITMNSGTKEEFTIVIPTVIVVETVTYDFILGNGTLTQLKAIIDLNAAIL